METTQGGISLRLWRKQPRAGVWSLRPEGDSALFRDFMVTALLGALLPPIYGRMARRVVTEGKHPWEVRSCPQRTVHPGEIVILKSKE